MAAAPTSQALAQTADDAAKADALFAEGRRLMAHGDYESACPKFAEAERLRHGVGTLLNLADCYERMGKTASASRVFRQAAAAAEAVSDPRVEIAHRRERALEARLLRLTVDTSRVAHVQGLEVLRDQVAVAAEQWGQPVVLDPGRYVIEVRAPGHEPFTQTVVLAGSSVVVEVPPFAAPAPTPPSAASAAPPAPTGATALDRPLERPPSGLSTQRKIALGVGAVGAAGLAVGGVFGALSLAAKNDAESHCQLGPERDQCDDQGWDANERAIERGNVATAGFAVGGVALGAALVLWLTGGDAAPAEAPSGVRVLPSFAPSAVGMTVSGGLP